MLKADSSALKSDSDDQRSATAPMIPSVAALSCTWWTSLMMLAIDVDGNARESSFTRKSDASARCTRPSSDSARNVSGTNERSAKYATIAARCGPRSAKNLLASCRFRTRTSAVWQPVSLGLHGRGPGTRRSEGDLVADRGCSPLRLERVGPGI